MQPCSSMGAFGYMAGMRPNLTTAHPSSHARRKSFCWCFSGKLGGYSPFLMAAPLMLNSGFAMAPVPSTSSNVSMLRSDLLARDMPSENAPAGSFGISTCLTAGNAAKRSVQTTATHSVGSASR